MPLSLNGLGEALKSSTILHGSPNYCCPLAVLMPQWPYDVLNIVRWPCIDFKATVRLFYGNRTGLPLRAYFLREMAVLCSKYRTVAVQ